MITFKQMCEWMVGSEPSAYSYFTFPSDYVVNLTEEELSSVKIVPWYGETVHVWFPKERFYERKIDKVELDNLLREAIEKENWEEIIRLKKLYVKPNV